MRGGRWGTGRSRRACRGNTALMGQCQATGEGGMRGRRPVAWGAGSRCKGDSNPAAFRCPLLPSPVRPQIHALAALQPAARKQSPHPGGPMSACQAALSAGGLGRARPALGGQPRCNRSPQPSPAARGAPRRPAHQRRPAGEPGSEASTSGALGCGGLWRGCGRRRRRSRAAPSPPRARNCRDAEAPRRTAMLPRACTCRGTGWAVFGPAVAAACARGPAMSPPATAATLTLACCRAPRPAAAAAGPPAVAAAAASRGA